MMKIRIGYELQYQCPQPTPMIFTLNVHYSRVADLVHPDHMLVLPHVPVSGYRDSFGNWCTRLLAPAGRLRVTADAVINDSGLPETVAAQASQVPLQHLPEDSLQFLLGSRYCETDLLFDTAWSLFGSIKTGWQRVQSICDYVHQHITFGYQHARSTKTAFQVLQEKQGVCRDYAHLAITFCRCLNIPARYCTGYLGDIGLPPPYAPMDFAGWFEVYLEGGWYTFDARNNAPRIGRVLIARGRDAADVAISTSFGPTTLELFRVWTDEVQATSLSA
jgi:transglutaminase-like putative cysteine protease